MSYLVLARKYRPRNFEEMVGQPHVVQALSNALTQQRLHHAYLFTGTRGVGKTTVSRVLAKSLNCTGADGQGGITAKPCGICQACRDIDSGRFVDYVELDAASNRGVEEITQLLDQAVYKPVVGRFKVYMIDEVHMLSTTAFNAMLKTLEEPPEYLKFVLATTDPQKVPVTVLSRCLQFNLRPMPAQTVFEHLETITQSEQIEAEPGALRLLARAARGSMRDALSLTDQAIAYGSGHLEEAGVRRMLGAVDRGHVIRLIETLAAGDGAGLVQAVEALRAQGLPAAGTLEELAELVQRLAVIQAVPAAAQADELDAATWQRLAGLLAPDETQLLYSIALHGRAELPLAPDEHSGLLMVLLRMLAFLPGQGEGARPVVASEPATEARGVASRAAAPVRPAMPAAQPVAALADGEGPPPLPPEAEEGFPAELSLPAAGATAPSRALQASSGVRAEVRPSEVREARSPALPAVESRPEGAGMLSLPIVEPGGEPQPRTFDDPLGARWAVLVGEMAASGAIGALVRELAWQSQCVAVQSVDGGERWQLRVERESLRNGSHRERLEAAMTQALGHAVKLELLPGAAEDSPALRDTAEKQRRQNAAEALIRNDDLVVSLLQQFKSARIVPGSIKPI